MEETMERRLSDLRDYIENAENKLFYARKELNGIWDKLENNSDKTIKDIDSFKRELKRDRLYSDKLEEFLENYMKYYNK